jgi:glycosyltransferase involved in cell wall biosynthesis
MKICILTHDFPPGQGAALLYIDSLVRELVKLGIEIIVITILHDKNSAQIEKGENLTVYRFPVRGPSFLNNFEYGIRLLPFLEKIYKKEKFDLIHSEHVFPILNAGIFSKRKNIPHIAVIEGISKISLYSKLVYLAHKFLLPRSHFDVLISWSQFLIDEYFKKWCIDERKIEIISGGIDINKFNPFVDGTEIKEKLKTNDEKIIFTAKPLYKTNALGIAYIIKAMKYVFEKYDNCKLVIAGDGRKRKDLEKLAKDLNLEEKVEFLGGINQEKIPNYYKAADLVVNSLIYRHAGSMTILESLASGTPMVLTRIECLPGKKCVPTDDIAILVDPANDKDIARGILTLLKNEELGEKLGENAWKFIRMNFSMDKIARDYKKLYESLIK